ncbi:Auxin-responsive protein SAUR40 [Cardamine amara subsp. amara]|uniref:Auxin-responsive protein SAUR40 n=1 Tax=Cardamine amara subsp. amara TaxID=228776 RepID=A0ABD1AFU3_CARAN
MKPLIRRLSRVADSSSCHRIRSGDIHQPTAASSSSIFLVKRATVTSTVPSGHVPVNVGDEMERFVVSAELLNHPVFIGLLNRSAQEYGYAQKGVLHIPCNVFVFEQVVENLRSGNTDPSELVALLCGDDLSETTE